MKNEEINENTRIGECRMMRGVKREKKNGSGCFKVGHRGGGKKKQKERNKGSDQ